jgi:hypothetical protein
MTDDEIVVLIALVSSGLVFGAMLVKWIVRIGLLLFAAGLLVFR